MNKTHNDNRERFCNLCLHLGIVTGTLSDEVMREEVVASIRAGDLNKAYIEALRNYCDEILNRS